MASINKCVATALILAGSLFDQSFCQQQEITMTFEEYVQRYQKVYSSVTDKQIHKEVYLENVQNINKHNLQKDISYTKGINHLTVRTARELNAMKGLDRNLHRHQMSQRKPLLSPSLTLADIKDLPERVDWREKNVITPVKNQGECGSCWTFASAETIESHWAIKTGRLQELSEQFILDCTPNPQQCGGTGGCGGGTAELAYARLKTLGGIPSEWEYPYLSILGKASTCHGLPLTREKPHSGAVASAANVTGFHATETNSYASLISNLALQGPLAVSVDASAWHDYSGGIFDGGNHTNPDLDHLVQLVGYGTDKGKDYWLIRNSWT
jgi:cathepsin L